MAERRENRLTTKHADAKNKPGIYGDGRGLWLQIHKKGGKSWLFRYQWEGKTKELGLGSYERVGLREAQLAADVAREKVREGINPISEKAAIKLQAKQQRKLAELVASDRPIFGDYARSFVKVWIQEFKNKEHQRAWIKTFGLDPEPGRKPVKDPYAGALLDMAIDEIKTHDVLMVLNKLSKTPETQRRVRARIERVLDAAKVLGVREGDNPARWDGHLQVILARPKKLIQAHHPAMPYADLPAFMVKLRNLCQVRMDGMRDGRFSTSNSVIASMSVLALEFTILTAARTGEVFRARRSEIDLIRNIWTVPAERMKSGRVHRVPLSPRAVEILQMVWPLANDPDRYIFFGRSGDGHLSNMAMAMCLRGLVGRGVTLHGMRSAFRDWAGDATDYAREVAEAALAHVIGDQSEQAYRRGDALERRRGLMNAWGDYLDGKPVDGLVTGNPYAAGRTAWTSGPRAGQRIY